MTIAEIQKSNRPAFPPHPSKTKDHRRLNSLGAGGIEYIIVFILICHPCCPVFLMGQSKAVFMSISKGFHIKGLSAPSPLL